MEYEDELERMRNRKRRQKSRQQAGGERGFDGLDSRRRSQDTGMRRGRMEETDRAFSGNSGRDARGGGSRQRAREGAPEGADRRRGQRGYDDGYYDDSYEYGRHGGSAGNGDPYDSYEEYNDYDDYGEYDDYDDYEEYGRYEEHRRRNGSGRVSSSRDRQGRRGSGNEAGEGGSRDKREQKDRSVRGDAASRSGSGRNPEGSGSRTPRKKKRKFLFLKCFFLILMLLGAFTVFLYTRTGTGYWTIAVFGVDSRDGKLEMGALSDVEMICVIDRGTGDIKLVSVFRDTYLEINPDGTYHKINEAYFKGGHQQAVQALERNLDLSIDDYATFNWKAVVDAINILGGIDLEISDSEFKYINSFITETVESTGIGSHHLESAGMNHLDGVQAVAYARLRLMDTDYNRTARQRLVIQLAMNKAKEADLKTLTNLVKAILPQLSTSIGADDILPMARNIRKYHITETGGFPFARGETHIGKKDCVIPLTLESNVVQLHQFLYGTENFQPSQTVKQISAKVASDSGMGEVAENAPEAQILGQKALEGTGDGTPQSPGGSGSGSEDRGSGSPVPDNPGGNESPAGDPPAPEPAPPAQTDASEEAAVSQDALSEEMSEEGSNVDDGDAEEEGDGPVADTEESKAESSPAQTSQPGKAGPDRPGVTEPEIGPGMTEPASSKAPETSAESMPPETSEVGPGVG